MKKITLRDTIVADVPTINGRIYSRAVLQSAIDQYQERIAVRRAFGEYWTNQVRPTVDLSSVTHHVTRLQLLDDGSLESDIETIDTPQGRSLELVPRQRLHSSLRVFGHVNDGHVQNVEIIAVDVVKSGEDFDTKFAESFDARDWASAFVYRARRDPLFATDEGTVIGWFANALMRGFDEHANRVDACQKVAGA
jgi:hypothetical protein